jgi:glycosyltransferase involved in cell wall biosynthesis
MVLEQMPDFVDRIVVVNDASTDGTAEIVEKIIPVYPGMPLPLPLPPEDTPYNRAELVTREKEQKEAKYFTPATVWNQSDCDRIVLINHTTNGGVGAAIATGYKWCRDHHIECTAVMAGDGQMDPAELESICLPVLAEGIDYVKGNRLIHSSASRVIPISRFLGNSILSILTKIASGYWQISDTQTGYTAISLPALKSIRLHKIYKRYGMPNDLLVKLNIARCTIREVPIKPVYNIGEQSKMKIHKVVPKVSWLLVKSFFQRLWIKYLFRDFHPLFLLYHLSFLLAAVAIPYLVKIIRLWYQGIEVNELTAIAAMFLMISASQALLFAMWMDIQDNERLHK